MNNAEIVLYRNHINTYWDSFQESLNRRKTEQEYISYFEWQINIEQNRLNRFNVELQPDIYIDHKLIVDGQTLLIKRLRSLYTEFLKGGNDDNPIAPIKLNYRVQNDSLINILYEGLYPVFIKCTREEFRQHFETEMKEEQKIKWHGVENSIVHLFSCLKLSNNHWAEIITGHFINKRGKPFKNKQLVSIKSERIANQYTNSDVIIAIVQTIESL